MKKAPALYRLFQLTDRSEPAIELAVTRVFGYDVEHDAWQVGVCVNDQSPEAIFRRESSRTLFAPDATHVVWVREFAEGCWSLYDITQPLPASPLERLREQIKREATSEHRDGSETYVIRVHASLVDAL